MEYISGNNSTIKKIVKLIKTPRGKRLIGLTEAKKLINKCQVNQRIYFKQIDDEAIIIHEHQCTALLKDSHKYLLEYIEG